MPSTYEELVSQAHRLLRVKWDSPSSLAEELYAMLMPGIGSDIPQDAEAPEQSQAVAEVQRRLEEAQKFFSNIDLSSSVENIKATVNRPPASPFDRPLALAPPSFPGRPEEVPVRPVEVSVPPLPAQPFLTIPPVSPPPFISTPPPPISPFLVAPPVAPGPLAYSRPDLTVPKLPDLDWDGHVDSIPFGAGGGGGGALGLVLSGTGDTYKVDLYENGKNSAVTQSGVTVLIPQIADGEDIPDGTWISGILEVTSDAGATEFYFQPATWLS